MYPILLMLLILFNLRSLSSHLLNCMWLSSTGTIPNQIQTISIKSLTFLYSIATLSIIVVAIQAHRRKVCAGGVGLAGPIYYPQASSVMPHHQPYPQYQQYPPSPSLVPAFELHNQSRPANELPGGPQPFYQNGQWYQYQPVPVSGQSLQPRLASPTTTTQLHYPQQFQQTATTQAAPTTELAANYTKSEMES